MRAAACSVLSRCGIKSDKGFTKRKREKSAVACNLLESGGRFLKEGGGGKVEGAE